MAILFCTAFVFVNMSLNMTLNAPSYHLLEPASSDEDRPAKARRISRACLQCRARKQKCSPSVETSKSLQSPCKRCLRLQIKCSFETDETSVLDGTSPSRLAQLVVDLQSRINQHETRIIELEKTRLGKQTPPAHFICPSISKAHENRAESVPATVSPSQISVSLSGMDGISLGPPIATLRSLKVLSKHGQMHDPSVSPPESSRVCSFNPVQRRIISVEDAQKAVDIFFDHCHPSAPVLNETTRYSWRESNLHAPALILAICSIGTRFWFKGNTLPRDSAGGVHSSFNELTQLLDKAVSRLLLRPTPSDVTLDSIRLLLLYAQWMPCIQEEDEDVKNDTSTSRFPRSRYNEISAGAVLGLAMRYAHFVGLDPSAIAPLERDGKVLSSEDIDYLRVYYNLLTCNFNLMLTSGFPASVDFDPNLSVRITRAFGSQKDSQYPGDIRVSGLVELVAIVNDAMRSAGDVTGRQIGLARLLQLNEELVEWERAWLVRLKNTESRHSQLPFNSVRWYRLSLNSASLTPLLSVDTKFPERPLLASLHRTLTISLTSAAQMILSLSIFGAEYVWELDSQDPSTFPNGPYHADPDSIDRLFCAVDSTWISHTFAVTFLALCYIRGIINENLQIRTFTNDPIISSHLPKFSTSILAKLLHLAMEIFDGVCSIATFHTARDFQSVVHYASSLVLDSEDDKGNGEVNDYAFQSLLEIMNDSGVDWAGNLLEGFGENLDWSGNF